MLSKPLYLIHSDLPVIVTEVDCDTTRCSRPSRRLIVRRHSRRSDVIPPVDGLPPLSTQPLSLAPAQPSTPSVLHPLPALAQLSLTPSLLSPPSTSLPSPPMSGPAPQTAPSRSTHTHAICALNSTQHPRLIDPYVTS